MLGMFFIWVICMVLSQTQPKKMLDPKVESYQVHIAQQNSAHKNAVLHKNFTGRPVSTRVSSRLRIAVVWSITFQYQYHVSMSH